MIKVSEVIAVEGRYDKSTISNYIDATIVETDGFGIFKDKEKQALLRTLAKERGIIILTDSDGAGMVIRNFLKGIVPPQYIKNAYIPEILGKEKRKSSPSKEGKLGVEGMGEEVILASLKNAGATIENSGSYIHYNALTKADLYSIGLFGGTDSAKKRKELQERLGLPSKMSPNALLQVLNIISTRDEVLSLFSAEIDNGDND